MGLLDFFFLDKFDDAFSVSIRFDFFCMCGSDMVNCCIRNAQKPSWNEVEKTASWVEWQHKMYFKEKLHTNKKRNFGT